MQEVLGLKRLIILGVLLAIAGGQAAALNLYFMDRNKELRRDIRSTRSKANTISDDANTLRNDYELISKQQVFVDLLEKDNFISQQNRLEARNKIADIQGVTDILSASFSIASAQEVENPEMAEVNHTILSSRMTFQVTATSDVALYHFAYWIEQSFPGHIVLTGIDLERERKLDNNILKTMTQRGRLPLVKGTLNYLWRTITPVERNEIDRTFEELGLGGGF